MVFWSASRTELMGSQTGTETDPRGSPYRCPTDAHAHAHGQSQTRSHALSLSHGHTTTRHTQLQTRNHTRHSEFHNSRALSPGDILALSFSLSLSRSLALSLSRSLALSLSLFLAVITAISPAGTHHQSHQHSCPQEAEWQLALPLTRYSRLPRGRRSPHGSSSTP